MTAAGSHNIRRHITSTNLLRDHANGAYRRVQPDINFRRQFSVFSHFADLSHPCGSCTTLLSPRFVTRFSPSRSSLPVCNAHSWADAVPRGSVQHVFSPTGADPNPALNRAAVPRRRAKNALSLCVGRDYVAAHPAVPQLSGNAGLCRKPYNRGHPHISSWDVSRGVLQNWRDHVTV